MDSIPSDELEKVNLNDTSDDEYYAMKSVRVR